MKSKYSDLFGCKGVFIRSFYCRSSRVVLHVCAEVVGMKKKNSEPSNCKGATFIVFTRSLLLHRGCVARACVNGRPSVHTVGRGVFYSQRQQKTWQFVVEPQSSSYDENLSVANRRARTKNLMFRSLCIHVFIHMLTIRHCGRNKNSSLTPNKRLPSGCATCIASFVTSFG